MCPILDLSGICPVVRKGGMTNGIDPRDDLVDDDPGWRDLLVLIWDGGVADGIWQALNGLRCMGACLEPTRNGGARLVTGYMAPGEYAVLRDRWLRPFRDDLIDALQRVRL